MKHITSYKNKKSPKIRHFLPINITVASRTKIKSRKPLQIKGFWDFAHYSNSTITNQFCLEIIGCRVRFSFNYLIYPYYPAYMG